MRRVALASEAKRHCVRHADRVALFVRIEKRIKPIPQIARIPECQECADRKLKKEDGVTSSTVYRL